MTRTVARSIFGDLLIGLALRVYADTDPVKLSLAIWMVGTFSRASRPHRGNLFR